MVLMDQLKKLKKKLQNYNKKVINSENIDSNTIDIVNSKFINSIAIEYGGAINLWNAGFITIFQCIFHKNFAKYGGAIFYGHSNSGFFRFKFIYILNILF